MSDRSVWLILCTLMVAAGFLIASVIFKPPQPTQHWISGKIVDVDISGSGFREMIIKFSDGQYIVLDTIVDNTIIGRNYNITYIDTVYDGVKRPVSIAELP